MHDPIMLRSLVMVAAFAALVMVRLLVARRRRRPGAAQPAASPGAAAGARLSLDDLRSAAFSNPPAGKRGYNRDDVDAFLRRAEQRLLGRGELTAADVVAVGFSKPPAFQRGYDEDEVDAFLDRLAATIGEMDGRAR